uniref:Uncharacterized protein n=1 Tax=Anguilla anguilla TaxID=7936 RepID=A0A0E9SK53_ANGAN
MSMDSNRHSKIQLCLVICRHSVDF